MGVAVGVIELPRALSPWAGPLGIFPHDIALALSPWLPRLAGLLGGRGRNRGETGEPDGFDGIARRGTYDRLLASEWLLLSEAPDEFLRRVVAGEHAFLHPARRPPPAGRDVAVLFDAGPDQLGAPRIAQLAALVVLAARAERERGTLSWGVLQDQTGNLQLGVTKVGVGELLKGASPRPATRGDVARWLAVRAVASASETWLVGAEDLRPDSTLGASALVVTEPVERDARRIEVCASAAGEARSRAVVLDLPDERACVRLLRDPFEMAVVPRAEPPKGRIDPSAGLVFAANGSRVYLRGTSGELISAVVPSSPRMPVPPPATFSPGKGLTTIAVNVARFERRTVVVSFGLDSRGRKTYFRHLLSKNCRRSGGPTWFHPRDDSLFPASPVTPTLRRLWFARSGGLCFSDAEGRAVNLEGRYGPDLATGDDANPPRSPRGEFSGRVRVNVPSFPGESEIAGEVASEAGPSIVLVDASRRRLELWGDTRSELLRVTSAPIRHVVVEPDLRLIGFVTESGEVGVHSLRARAMVVSIAGEDGA